MIEYALGGVQPKEITISHMLLAEHRRLGQPWEVNFAVQIRHDDEQTWTPSLLTRTMPLRWTCKWSEISGVPPTTSAALHGTIDRSSVRDSISRRRRGSTRGTGCTTS